jgi:putative spermidine/putrescine transport system substrate-binding protein
MKTLKTLLKIMSIATISLSLMSGCSVTEKILDSNDSESQAWELITDSAARTEVVICVEPSDEAMSDWLQDEFATRLKSKYNVTLRVVPQTIDKTFEKIKDDIDQEREIGFYDVLLLNGDTFKQALQADYLYGPFTDKLPSANAYLNQRALELRYDEGVAIAGYEIPYAKSQLIMIYDENYFYDIPTTTDEFYALVQEFDGLFTYPDPRTSKEGEAFILSLMMPYLDLEKANSGDYTEEALKEAVMPALRDLKALSTYLYPTYPETVEALDALYKEGSVIMSMSLENNYATDQLKAYEYPEESDVFMLPEGTTGYTDYAAIAATSPNKSGAIVVIDELLSPDSQQELYDPKYIGKLPVYDMESTPTEALSSLKTVKLKSTTLSYDELLPMRMPELSPSVRQTLVNLWTQNVLTEATEE